MKFVVAYIMYAVLCFGTMVAAYRMVIGKLTGMRLIVMFVASIIPIIHIILFTCCMVIITLVILATGNETKISNGDESK